MFAAESNGEMSAVIAVERGGKKCLWKIWDRWGLAAAVGQTEIKFTQTGTTRGRSASAQYWRTQDMNGTITLIHTYILLNHWRCFNLNHFFPNLHLPVKSLWRINTGPTQQTYTYPSTALLKCLNQGYYIYHGKQNPNIKLKQFRSK